MGKATLIRMILALVASLAITACGFHLRGSYEMPVGLHALTLTTPGSSSALRDELVLTLGRAHVSTDGGDTELEITRELLTKQTTTVDSRAKAAEYTLIYTVDYRLQSTGSNVPGAIQSLILRRGYQYDTTNIVGKSTEEETLVQELREDAVHQIVRQLRSWTPDINSVTPAP